MTRHQTVRLTRVSLRDRLPGSRAIIRSCPSRRAPVHAENNPHPEINLLNLRTRNDSVGIDQSRILRSATVTSQTFLPLSEFQPTSSDADIDRSPVRHGIDEPAPHDVIVRVRI